MLKSVPHLVPPPPETVPRPFFFTQAAMSLKTIPGFF